MANTGSNKKLASFNCDEDLWEQFQHQCQQKGTTATATLTKFIELYLDEKLDNLDVELGLAPDLEERIKASVNGYLDKNMPSHIDKYLAANYLSNNPRTHRNSTKPIKESEFWLIQDRAKYLGLKIHADQRIKIEMFAHEAVGIASFL